jgi:hypothetical protein
MLDIDLCKMIASPNLQEKCKLTMTLAFPLVCRTSPVADDKLK